MVTRISVSTRNSINHTLMIFYSAHVSSIQGSFGYQSCDFNGCKLFIVLKKSSYNAKVSNKVFILLNSLKGGSGKPQVPFVFEL